MTAYIREGRRRYVLWWLGLSAACCLSSLLHPGDSGWQTEVTRGMLGRLGKRLDESTALPRSIGAMYSLGFSGDGGVADTVAIDAWHRPIMYMVDKRGYQLRSAGKDGRYYSNDDIVSSGPQRASRGRRGTSSAVDGVPRG